MYLTWYEQILSSFATRTRDDLTTVAYLLLSEPPTTQEQYKYNA